MGIIFLDWNVTKMFVMFTSYVFKIILGGIFVDGNQLPGGCNEVF